MDDPSPQPLSAHESARLLGGLAWVEVQLFEVLGAWVLVEPDLDAQACFAVLSTSSAWRAEQVLAAMPAPRDLERDDVLAATYDEAAGFVERLRALSGAGQSRERLEGVVGTAHPWLESAYNGHLARCTPVADGPVVRAVHRALADLALDRAEVSRLLDR